MIKKKIWEDIAEKWSREEEGPVPPIPPTPPIPPISLDPEVDPDWIDDFVKDLLSDDT